MGEPASNADLRERILREPDVILEDMDVMRALVAASDRQAGDNVIDLRGLAMRRLEQRLDCLEETHRSVIAAAYDNLSGTRTIHRAVLSLLDPPSFPGFLATLEGPVSEALRAADLRLILETETDLDTGAPGLSGRMLVAVAPGTVARLTDTPRGAAPRRVTLRDGGSASARMPGGAGGGILSEAILTLDLGPGRLPGAVLLGSREAQQFAPGQGTDLLEFFAGTLERVLRRWLA
ncbi:hypothetical protein OCGS_1301 [Oceaniovalibus guishaninsula JLT2003]|uniref:Recombinase XerC n=1 Tax=Oceaniovalibus guishaninsula JLT2003 TaxID=1231392 RepID=K2HAA7_9RHOB|nr:DUF484 family protein [Oceaniovalibus guishaninsula]EKE44463.1 hypothetical protein OCGS_1301 [Oceaniovalibus guishaninsula JLT2003]